MQALVEMLIGFIAMIAATALAQFGVNLDAHHGKPEREIHRVRDCAPAAASSLLAERSNTEDC